MTKPCRPRPAARAAAPVHAVRGSRRSVRGYTAAEVLISMVLLGVGSAGVISMERGAVLANAQARNMDTANAIARTWIERLRADTTQWTLPNTANPALNNITATKFLVDGTTILIDTGRDPTDNGWFLPNQQLAAGISPAFDQLGRDLPYLTTPSSPTAATPDIRFCTHVRIQCLVPTVTIAGAATTCSLMRAQVRVFWPKNLVTPPSQTFCATTNLATIEANPAAYHFVYAVTALRQNVAP